MAQLMYRSTVWSDRSERSGMSIEPMERTHQAQSINLVISDGRSSDHMNPQTRIQHGRRSQDSARLASYFQIYRLEMSKQYIIDGINV